MAQDQNYTLGRGRLFFARFKEGTQIPEGERYIGNTPEFNLSIDRETLDHFSSDGGVREKDDSISLQTNRTGSLITDAISPENIALFFFGEALNVSVVGATITDELHESVMQGLHYQLGATESNPVGNRGLTVHTAPTTNIIVKDTAGSPVTFVEGTDYTIDMATGMLYIVPGGNIDDETDIEVTYKTTTSTRSRVISGSTPVEGQLRFIADNPKGDNLDYLLPWVQLSPNGDYALKGDEWQQIPFNIDVLKKVGLEAIYVDGRAFVA